MLIVVCSAIAIIYGLAKVRTEFDEFVINSYSEVSEQYKEYDLKYGFSTSIVDINKYKYTGYDFDSYSNRHRGLLFTTYGAYKIYQTFFKVVYLTTYPMFRVGINIALFSILIAIHIVSLQARGVLNDIKDAKIEHYESILGDTLEIDDNGVKQTKKENDTQSINFEDIKIMIKYKNKLYIGNKEAELKIEMNYNNIEEVIDKLKEKTGLEIQQAKNLIHFNKIINKYQHS